MNKKTTDFSNLIYGLRDEFVNKRSVIDADWADKFTDDYLIYIAKCITLDYLDDNKFTYTIESYKDLLIKLIKGVHEVQCDFILERFEKRKNELETIIKQFENEEI